MTVYSYWQKKIDTLPEAARKLNDLMWQGPDGVRVDSTGKLAVTAQTTPDMSVQVASGWGKSSGYVGVNDGPYRVTIDQADGANPRRDLIVMRWRDDPTGATESSCKLEAIKGAPAPNPQLPSTAGMIVTVLGEVRVDANVASITAAAITDRRTLVNMAAAALDQGVYAGDLNKLVLAGMYSTAGGTTNAPGGLNAAAAHVVVERTGMLIRQTWTRSDGSVVFERMSADGGTNWQAWRSVVPGTGTQGGTTNTDGRASIAHNLGWVPTRFMVQSTLTGGTPASTISGVDNITATTAVVRFYSVTAASTYGLAWMAWL